MKKKLSLIFLSGAIALTTGIGIAYYNTERTGFNSEAEIIYYDKEKISVMNRDIYYKDVVDFYDKITSYIPEKTINIRADYAIM